MLTFSRKNIGISIGIIIKVSVSKQSKRYTALYEDLSY